MHHSKEEGVMEEWSIGVMEYWSIEKTGNDTEQEATTKTRSLPAVNLAGYESTKEEGVI